MKLHQRDEAEDLGLFGRKLAQEMPQAKRFGLECGPHHVVAGVAHTLR